MILAWDRAMSISTLMRVCKEREERKKRGKVGKENI
jgi:hypothetical protein